MCAPKHAAVAFHSSRLHEITPLGVDSRRVSVIGYTVSSVHKLNAAERSFLRDQGYVGAGLPRSRSASAESRQGGEGHPPTESTELKGTEGHPPTKVKSDSSATGAGNFAEVTAPKCKECEPQLGGAVNSNPEGENDGNEDWQSCASDVWWGSASEEESEDPNEEEPWIVPDAGEAS